MSKCAKWHIGRWTILTKKTAHFTKSERSHFITFGLDEKDYYNNIFVTAIQLAIDQEKIEVLTRDEATSKGRAIFNEAKQMFEEGDFSKAQERILRWVEEQRELHQTKNQKVKNQKRSQQNKKKVINCGRTGLAKTGEFQDQSENKGRILLSELKTIAIRTVICMAIFFGGYLLFQSDSFADNQPEEVVQANALHTLPFENIEVELVEVDDGESRSVLRYEMVNRNPDRIIIGVYDESHPLDGYVPKEKTGIFGSSINEVTFRLRYQDDILDFNRWRFELEPNQKTTVTFTIDGPLEEFVGFDTYIQNETTGEIRKWTHDF